MTKGMIYSKPSDRGFRDHDLIIDSKGAIYVVVGNEHPPGEVFAYVKYVPTAHKTPWRNKWFFYERVLREYSASNVRESSRRHGGIAYDYVFGAPMPRICLSSIIKWLRPEVRLRELISSPRDKVEEDVVEAVTNVARSTGVRTDAMGISGSVLAGIHNPLMSDINLIIYGCRESISIAESEICRLEPLSRRVLYRRIVRKSRIYGLPPNVVIKLYPNYQLKSVNGRPVGISFVSEYQLRYGERCFKPIAPCEALVEVIGGDCRALFYPSIAEVDRVHDIKVEGSIKYSYMELKRLVKYVISFEGLFRHALYVGGLTRIKGILEEVVPCGQLAIIVGGAEEPGYVLPTSLLDGTSSLGTV